MRTAAQPTRLPAVAAPILTPIGITILALGVLAVLALFTKFRRSHLVRHGLVLLPSGGISTTANSAYLNAYHRYAPAVVTRRSAGIRSAATRAAVQMTSYAHLSSATTFWLVSTCVAGLWPATFYLVRFAIRRPIR